MEDTIVKDEAADVVDKDSLRVKLSNLSLNYGHQGSQQLISLGSSSRSGSLNPESHGFPEVMMARAQSGPARESYNEEPSAGLTRSAGFESLVAAFGDSDNKRKFPELPHKGKLLSIFYGLVLIILAVALPVGEALRHEWLTEIFIAVYLVYLYGVAVIVIISMEIYLSCVSRRQKSKTRDGRTEQIGSEAPRAPSGVINLGFDDDDRPVRGSQLYSTRADDKSGIEGGFNERSRSPVASSDVEGRHTTLYLRIVLIVLGLAAMVYDGLLVKQLHEGFSPTVCARSTRIWPHYVHIAMLVIQTYFLFKHPKIPKVAGKALFRLGFVHLLASNVCVLWRTLVRQILDDYLYNVSSKDSSGQYNETFPASSCNYSEDILFRAAPYLYPCVIEYNILAAAVVYMLYTSLDEFLVFSAEPSRAGHTEINCQRTHKGLFFGVVLVAGTFVTVILFFAYNLELSAPNSTSLLIYQIGDLALHGILLVTVAVAWIQTGRLSFFSQIYLTVEDGILLFSMATGVLFSIFKVIPAIEFIMEGKDTDINVTLSLVCSLVAMVTLVFQTSFLVDLTCRYISLDEEWDTKPGRAAVTFLILANISLWLLKCFQIKALDLEAPHQGQTYGTLSWQIMVYALVPVLIFYYVFSSACLAKIWQRHYTKPRRHSRPVESPTTMFASTPGKDLDSVRLRHSRQRHADSMNIGDIWSPVSDV